MFSIIRFVFPVAKFFAPTVFVLFAVSGFTTPAADILDETHAAVQAVMAVQEEVTPALMQQPEILGTAISVGPAGNRLA